jgi:hypothetical protein
MALQGKLDTFELQDVLRLLASTAKTGRLRLDTDRGTGSVWMDGGSVVAVESPGGAGGDATDGIFDLLRAREGSFDFVPEEAPAAAEKPMDVEPLLASAEERLVEWREIEKVVPSMFSWVRLAEELPAPEVTIDAPAWRTVTAIGSGVTVADLGHSLDLSEVSVCRLVRDLVEMGLGSVSDEGPTVAPAAAEWAAPANDRFKPIEFDDPPRKVVSEPAPLESVPFDPEPERFEPEPARLEPVSRQDRFEPSSFEPSSFGDNGAVADADDDAELSLEDRLAPVTPLPQRVEAPTRDEAADLADDEADEVARQLAQLSPRAAQAVAAAAAAETEAERDAALDALDETDASVNRDLLLKFLGSVKG